MKFELKGFGILSVTKMSTVFGAIGGLIYGIIMAAMPYQEMFPQTGNQMMDTLYPIFFGKMAIIILPIMYAIFGAISGAIYSALYNFLVNYIGGIQMELIPISENGKEISEASSGEDKE